MQILRILLETHSVYFSNSVENFRALFFTLHRHDIFFNIYTYMYEVHELLYFCNILPIYLYIYEEEQEAITMI